MKNTRDKDYRRAPTIRAYPDGRCTYYEPPIPTAKKRPPQPPRAPIAKRLDGGCTLIRLDDWRRAKR
jgi:hypothetical protein